MSAASSSSSAISLASEVSLTRPLLVSTRLWTTVGARRVAADDTLDEDAVAGLVVELPVAVLVGLVEVVPALHAARVEHHDRDALAGTVVGMLGYVLGQLDRLGRSPKAWVDPKNTWFGAT